MLKHWCSGEGCEFWGEDECEGHRQVMTRTIRLYDLMRDYSKATYMPVYFSGNCEESQVLVLEHCCYEYRFFCKDQALVVKFKDPRYQKPSYLKTHKERLGWISPASILWYPGPGHDCCDAEGINYVAWNEENLVHKGDDD